MELQKIQQMIYEVRGVKVMLDTDLAVLYGVETKALKRAVRRNIQRFPSDFMFEVTPQEQKKLKFQIGTSSLSENQEVTNLRYQNGTSSWGGIRYNAFAFTELIKVYQALTELGESEKGPIPEVGFAAIEKRRNK